MSKTPQEFIQSAFSPVIATLCSPKVEHIVAKNNLTLPDLLQPFTLLDWEGQFRDPGGSICIVKNLKLVIRDLNWKPLQPTEARRELNNAVLHNYDEKTVRLNIEGRVIDIPQSTPWFDAWRETYFEVQFPSDHEFTKHFLSCIIVGTTLDDNIVDTYNSLNQQYAQLQSVTPPKLPKWFNSTILKIYLLLNDISAVPKEKADVAFETLKQTFGAANCYLLSINSKSSSDPKLSTDYWSHCVKQTTDFATELSTSLTNLTSIVAQETASQSSAHESPHPLTTTDYDVYDNANSLQTHSFSGSAESVYVPVKQSESVTENHGALLTSRDIEAIKKFLVDFTSQALIPHVEKLIAQLTEVVANKKGVSRSLLSATKRWFTTGKSGTAAPSNAVVYSTDCPELQLRRLGDLWFLFGQWQRAYDAYHTAKREFYADSAWLCYAGALEMAAISAFMAGESNRKTFSYIDESITTYQNTCRMVQYAVRATLLSVPCLISAGMHGEAAKQLIRMTSEDSDLRSAMLLEQAALCFLKGPSNTYMTRKYAFHIVLAGHRFSKAGQKKHAYRCYNQAYQVYATSGWRLSTDHVQFALGRLAGTLRQPRAAARWLAAPLAPAAHAARQPPHMQDAFLREFMQAHQQWVENSDEFKDNLPILPVPLLVSEETAVLCVGPAPLSSPGRIPATSVSLPPHSQDLNEDNVFWHKLEESVIQVAQGSVPMIFKATTDLYNMKTESNPIVPQGEPIQISVTLHNPLKVSLHLKEIEMLWQFTPNEADTDLTINEVLNNEPALASGQYLESNVIHGQKIKSLLLEGECRKILTFTVTPLKTGQVTIKGLAFKLVNAGEGKEVEKGVTIFGKLCFQTGANCSDKILQILVIPHAPCLQMTFSEIDKDVISGEIKNIDIEFRNVGPVDIRKLHLAVSHPDCMSIVLPDEPRDDFKMLYEEKYSQPPAFPDERTARAVARASACGRVARAVAGGRATLLLRPTARARLYLLAYYETGLKQRPYRLLRHCFNFISAEAVEVLATPRRGFNANGEELQENMCLAIEVKNVCKDNLANTTVEILDASLLSRQWKLTDVTISPHTNNTLMSRERFHIVFNAKRILEELPDGTVNHSILKIAKYYDSQDNFNLSSFSKFVIDGLPSVIDPIVPINPETFKRTGLIQSMFVLRWKACNKDTGKSVVGQHCLWLDCFTKNSTSSTQSTISSTLGALDNRNTIKDQQKNENSNVVIFKLDHSDSIDHNFKTNRICMIPIVINVVNCYGDPVTVFIDMSKQQNRGFSELGWAGALNTGFDSNSKQLGVKITLKKFESRRVQVQALCAAPGTYQVGSAFSISTMRGTNNQATTQFVNNTSLLIVKQIV